MGERESEREVTHDNDEITDDVRQKYDTLIARREAGEPVPYIIGEQEFFSRPFKVREGVLIPRPDTETLIETVLAQATCYQAKTLLDMGTGSGCIAITLALEMPELRVTATDFSDKALIVAKENADALQAKIEFHQGSWYEALPEGARFDIIVSNPPYIHPEDHHLANLRYEPITALTDGYDGLKDLRAIVAGAPDHLQSGGLLAMEHGWDQGEAVRNLFDSDRWCDVKTIKDLGENDRVTLGRLKR